MNFTTAELLYVGRLSPSRHWSLGAHSHPHHELIVVVAGCLHVQMRGQAYRAACGELLWYPTGVPHAEASDPGDPGETYFLGLVWPDGPPSLPVQQTDQLGRVAHLARWLFDERGLHPQVRAALHRGGLQAILAEVVRLATAAPQSLATGLRAYLRQNLTRRLSLDDLASRAKMSKYHFVRRYRQLTGRTPMEDVRWLRLEAARDLLLTTSLPLKDIAPRCGLGDEYHLSHLFRRHFHTSPGQLRQRTGRR